MTTSHNTHDTAKEKIGLLFGSFNPIHIGHLIISESMLENGRLNKVWFVITPRNPLKKKTNLLHQFDRYDLVCAAVADHGKLQASDVEFTMSQPNYTAHTLAVLAEKFPHKQFILIMGEDNLRNFSQWKNNSFILNRHEIYVYPRPHKERIHKKHHPHIKWIEAPMLDISATYIREAIKQNRSIRYLVPEPVEQMIKTKGFYLS